MSEQQNTQQPAWWHARINGAHDAFFNELPPDDAYDEGTLTALYTTPPVPRDVLMAFGEAVRNECRVMCDVFGAVTHIDLSALADRYASQVQPDTGARRSSRRRQLASRTRSSVQGSITSGSTICGTPGQAGWCNPACRCM